MSITLDTPLTSVKQSTHQRYPVFTHALSSQANTPIPSRQFTIQTTYTSNENSSIGNRKLTKVLSDPPIFINGKDPSIDQWLSKMQGKFKINWDHYPTERSKLIYIENRVGEKALQHLEPCLQLNLITLFATIEDLFNYLEDIFANPHWKDHAMEKFRDLKMGARSFNDFYSEFIRLALELEYTSKMLI